MALALNDLVDGGRIALGGLKDFAQGIGEPSLRLGVTGLSRSGKTVFITALVHALLKQARMPVFEAHAQGRITRAYLEPQPDDDLPRFPYEANLAALTAQDRAWPEGTRRISQLRLTLEYEPRGFFARNFGRGRLHIDIIDYPGEWLLDLPLMKLSYQEWSAMMVEASRKIPRNKIAREWHHVLNAQKWDGPSSEEDAEKAAVVFTAYLAKCREDEIALSSLPPGRFLMPGDLQGSPLLTFAPLDLPSDATITSGSLASLMERRYNSYVAHVVKPFYFGHFARLDRQIVLVDVLSALNAGPSAIQDLQTALTDVLASFRLGTNTYASTLFGRRIDKVLFAATKADLIHHQSHDRLEAILNELLAKAATRAEFQGAAISSVALASIRATREATVKQRSEELACIAGLPEIGQSIDGQTFDGETEAAIFPGDLPESPQSAIDGSMEGQLRFVKFRPPELTGDTFAHVRLDRALEFLLGDRFP